MYTQTNKGTHYHKFWVDSESGDQICLCGAVKDKTPDAPKKFHNNSSEYNGYIYQSKLEQRYAVDLDWRLKAKDIKGWERQVKIAFVVCPKCARMTASHCPDHPSERQFHLANYYIDFVIYHKDGTKEYVECKGMELSTWKLKWTMLEAVYGNSELVKLTLVKEPKTKKRYYGKKPELLPPL